MSAEPLLDDVAVEEVSSGDALGDESEYRPRTYSTDEAGGVYLLLSDPDDSFEEGVEDGNAYRTRRRASSAERRQAQANQEEYRNLRAKSGRWWALAHCVGATVLGMCTWFSAGAVLPQLCVLWKVGSSEGSLLTIGVNMGFLCGALTSTLTRLPDRVCPTKLMGIGAAVAAILNVLLMVPGEQFGIAIALRFGTGAAMALVYPMACKLVCTWFDTKRGIAMGAAIGAVVLGSAAPHLVNACAVIRYEVLVYACSGLSLGGALWAFLVLKPGPFAVRQQAVQVAKAKFTDDTMKVLRNREVCLAIAAYCGHSWEIYALWQCFRQYVIEKQYGEHFFPTDEARGASLIAFMVVGIGFFGSIAGGVLSDVWGRTKLCLLSLLSSGAVSIVINNTSSFPVMLVLGLYWGITVVSDSAQYSALVTELADPALMGTAITIQFGFGFLFTVPGMYLIPAVAGMEKLGWTWAWRSLAPGALVGIASLIALRRCPAARHINGGKM